MYNNYMNGYNPGYGTGYNQNNYGNYGMMQSQIPTQSIAQTSLQGMQTGQGYNYPSNAQNGVRVFSVGSYDEAKAIPTDFSGDMLILTDLYHGRKEKKKMKRYSLYFTSKSRYKKALSLMYKKPSIYNEIVGGLSGSKQYYISWRMQ